MIFAAVFTVRWRVLRPAALQFPYQTVMQLVSTLACRSRGPTGEGRDRAGPSSRDEVRVLQPLFIVPKKDGGLRPILDLRVLNRALHKLPFRMLTQRCIFQCVRPLDWFAAIDLKDAYFHASILPRHRPFLRFGFEGEHTSTRPFPSGYSCRLVSSPRSYKQPLYC